MSADQGASDDRQSNQHHGFFTPLFHIAAVTGSSSAMMTSMQQAMAGMMIAAIARVLPRRWWLAAGTIFELAVFAGSAFTDLPAVASITGSGDVIASMVGGTTFAIDRVMFGIALAVHRLATSPKASPSHQLAADRKSPVAA